MHQQFESEIESALARLRAGDIILYPTDTIWGLGCDATNATAVEKIYRIKKRPDSKSLIVLMTDEKDILKYTASTDLSVFNFLQDQERPTTVIFNHAVNLPANLIATDGSIAIRLVKDAFCRHLIKRLGKPLVSTSANISGEPPPSYFDDISDEVKQAVDYIVNWRQNDITPALPSRIIRWKGNGNYDVIRD